MNWNEITGRWRLLTARAEAVLGGKDDAGGPNGLATGTLLLGKVRKHYGTIKLGAGRKIDSWMTPRSASTASETVSEPDVKKADKLW
jgi:hypothetical protein